MLARRRIGHSTFHLLHLLTYAAFILALLHSWFAGTDTPALELFYLSSGLLVFFLTVYRLLGGLNERRPAALQRA